VQTFRKRRAGLSATAGLSCNKYYILGWTLEEAFILICHLTSNVLPHYSVKFECSTVQPYRIVIQFKSVHKSYIFSKWMTWSQSHVCANSFTTLQHALKIAAISTHACFEWCIIWCMPTVNGCVDDTYCSMLSQAFNRCCWSQFAALMWRQITSKFDVNGTWKRHLS